MYSGPAGACGGKPNLREAGVGGDYVCGVCGSPASHCSNLHRKLTAGKRLSMDAGAHHLLNVRL
jgi:hypothetical protein